MTEAIVMGRAGPLLPRVVRQRGRTAVRRFHREFRLYVVLLTALVAVAVPGARAAFVAQPGDASFLLVLMVLASLLSVSVDPERSVDWQLDTPVAVAAAVLLPPPLAAAVAFLGFTNQRELRMATSPWLSLFNRGQIAVGVWIAALAVAPVVADRGVPRLVLATSLAVAVHTATSLLLFWIGHSLLRREAQRLPRIAIDFLLVSGLAFPIVVVEANFGPLAVLLLSFPMGLGYRAILTARENAQRAAELALQVRELETLTALGKRLLAEGERERAVFATRRALIEALGTDDVVVEPDGVIPAHLVRHTVPGAAPAAIGVPHGLSEGSVAAVQAMAGLLGMGLVRVALSAELAEVQRARAALSGQIMEEGTRERSRIALEIHDDVLPHLAAAEIQADNVRTSLSYQQVERAGELALRTANAVSGGIARLRAVLDQLRRQIIVPGSLGERLQEVLDTLQLEHGVHGRLQMPEQLPPLPLAVEILVFETVRGCLANVAEHAHAEQVTVTVALQHPGISASICDDGRGFDTAAVREGAHGLSLMAQRVDLARGRFEVTSAIGKGTRVHVEVPL